LDFVVRLLHHLYPNPNIKDFEWMEKNYKAKWDMLNRVRGEVFSKNELDDMKLAGKAGKKTDAPGTPGGSIVATPKTKSSIKRKLNAQDDDDEAVEGTPAKKTTPSAPKAKKSTKQEDSADKGVDSKDNKDNDVKDEMEI
jgi:hypothetical protein